jgi:UDP-4-amino-4,6-dideoxy-N-acetyl-beta-L-altrosamine N-acetyltransferase
VLRPATDSDRESILRWRNHPDVRAVSLTRHVISPDEHASWWEAVQQDSSRKVLVYERKDVPSGVVTFFDIDTDARSAWWGFYLDIDGLTERGELLPVWVAIEREAVRFAFEELGLEVLEGEVLASNQAVRNMNRRHRFTETGSDTRVVDGEQVEVVHMRLDATEFRRGRSERKDV